MNDTILRGFCKKCGKETNYTEYIHNAPYHEFSLQPVELCEIDWFLSAQQMTGIIASEIYQNWAITQNKSMPINVHLLPKLLENEPFLVAKILKETEEKNL